MYPPVRLAYIDFNGGSNPQPLAENHYRSADIIIGDTYREEWGTRNFEPHHYITGTDDRTIKSTQTPQEWWYLHTAEGERVKVYGDRYALNLLDGRVLSMMKQEGNRWERVFWDNCAGKLENASFPDGTVLENGMRLNDATFRDAWRHAITQLGSQPLDVWNGGHFGWYNREPLERRMFEQHHSDPYFCHGWAEAEWAALVGRVMVPRLESSRVTLEAAVAYAVCMTAMLPDSEAAWHFGTYTRRGWLHLEVPWVPIPPRYVVKDQRIVRVIETDPRSGMEREKEAKYIKVWDINNRIEYKTFLRPSIDTTRLYDVTEYEGCPLGGGTIEKMPQRPLFGPDGHLSGVGLPLRTLMAAVKGAVDDGYPEVQGIYDSMSAAEKGLAELENQ